MVSDIQLSVDVDLLVIPLGIQVERAGDMNPLIVWDGGGRGETLVRYGTTTLVYPSCWSLVVESDGVVGLPAGSTAVGFAEDLIRRYASI